jgi:G3E family GTPase
VQMIMVSGFLGSGKTTLIVQLAKVCVVGGLRVAILVNEVGEIGIDDGFMRRLGLNVRELLGGCICCTLATDLVETLRQLEKGYHPDIILLEPSGVADPTSVHRSLDLLKAKPMIRLRHIMLIDPLRLRMLMEVLTPLTIATMESANIVCINKTDAADEEELDYARETVRKVNPRTKVLEISAKNGIDVNVLGAFLA